MNNATKQQNSSNAREGQRPAGHADSVCSENAGMTQEEASKLFEVNRSTYAYYETGKSHPKYPLLCKMAHAYEVSTDYLLGMKSAASNTADTLHDAGVAYDANNEQPSSYLKGQINDGIAELSNVERMVLFRLRIMDKEDQNGILNFINCLGELNKEEWETLFRLCVIDKENQKKVLDFTRVCKQAIQHKERATETSNGFCGSLFV